MIHSLDVKNLWEMATSYYMANWHPLTWFSHAIDYQLFGIDPAGHHLTNIIIHSLNSLLVFILFIRLVVKVNPQAELSFTIYSAGLIAALLFGVHPLRVESVVWVSERKDILCAFFVLLTYISYLTYVSRENKTIRKKWYIITLSLFVLALMSKPMAVTVPVVFLILDAFPLNRLQTGTNVIFLILEKIPFFILSLLCGIMTIFAQSRGGALVPIDYLGLDSRLLNAFSSLMFYLQKTVWPTYLVPLYPFPSNISLYDVTFFGAILGFLGISLFCVWRWKKKQPLYLAVWMYYLVTVAPVIGVIQVGRQGAADRYTYLPTLGFFILAGIGMIWILNKRRSRTRSAIYASTLAWTLAVMAIIWMSFLTQHQTRVWKNSETLWRHVANSYPEQIPSAYYNLGNVYAHKEKFDWAEVNYKFSLSINKNYLYARNGLGLLYAKRNQFDKAENQYRLALKIRSDALVHNNLGLLYVKTKRWAEAKNEYLTALQIKSDFPHPHNNLGILYNKTGQSSEAEKEFKAALNIDINFAEAHFNLGDLYKKRGQLKDAEIAYQRGLHLDPNYPEIHNSLGEIYLQTGQKQSAEKAFKQALKQTPNYSQAKQNLQTLQ